MQKLKLIFFNYIFVACPTPLKFQKLLGKFILMVNNHNSLTLWVNYWDSRKEESLNQNWIINLLNNICNQPSHGMWMRLSNKPTISNKLLFKLGSHWQPNMENMTVKCCELKINLKILTNTNLVHIIFINI